MTEWAPYMSASNENVVAQLHEKIQKIREDSWELKANGKARGDAILEALTSLEKEINSWKIHLYRAVSVACYNSLGPYCVEFRKRIEHLETLAGE